MQTTSGGRKEKPHHWWLACLALTFADQAPAQAAGVDAYSIAGVLQTPSYEDQELLFRAIDAGDLPRIRSHINFVKSFLAVDSRLQVVNLEFVDTQGNTPLIRAAAAGQREIVHFLLDSGANINAANAKYETALIRSYNNRFYQVAKDLIARGAQDPYQAGRMMAEYDARLQAAQVVAQEEETSNAMIQASLVAAGVGAAGAVWLFTADEGESDSAGGASAPSLDCGASSGIHPEACNAATFNTAEAQGQEGVLGMNTLQAFAHGYDGRIFNRDINGNLDDDDPDGNVLVAVMDTGADLDHPDLDANLRTDLAATCLNTGCSAGGEDADGHGTFVSGIIAAERDGVGMHGVAPSAEIIPIAFLVNNGSSRTAFQYANDQNAQVINNSWGLVYDSATDPESIPIVAATGPVTVAHPAGTYSALTPAQLRTELTVVHNATTSLAELQQAVSDSRIIVFAAGNSALDEVGLMGGLPLYFQGAVAPAGVIQGDYDTVNPDHYDWSDNWVVSVSLDDNDAISSFSNQCGVAKDWCLAAPGEISASTYLGGTYASGDGTSFSAPNITGAIAIMLGAFPQLDPEEVLDILFDTATDLGAAGVDDVYGHGLVDLQKATDPTLGGWTFSVIGFGGGGNLSLPFVTSHLGLTGAFGNALKGSNASLIFQDSYNKDYTIPLSAIAGNLTRRESAYDRFRTFARSGFDNVVNVGEGAMLGFTPQADAIPGQSGNTEFGKASYQSVIPMGTDKMLVGFAYNNNMADSMQDVATQRLSLSGASSNPYLNLVESASSSMLGYQSGRTMLRVSAYSGDMNGEQGGYGYRFNEGKNAAGFASEVTYLTGRASQVTVESGVMLEENSFLGSEATGAFGIDRASTYYTGVSGKLGLAQDISLIAGARLGLTNISASQNSFFTDFNQVMTSSFALGAEFRNLANKRDVLGLLISQPLRVERGKANLALPVDVAANNNVMFKRQSMSLAPKGREFDFETYYSLMSSERSSLSMNAIWRTNPDNDNNAADELMLLGKYKLGF